MTRRLLLIAAVLVVVGLANALERSYRTARTDECVARLAQVQTPAESIRLRAVQPGDVGQTRQPTCGAVFDSLAVAQ